MFFFPNSVFPLFSRAHLKIPNMKYYIPRFQSCFVCVSRVITRSIFNVLSRSVVWPLSWVCVMRIIHNKFYTTITCCFKRIQTHISRSHQFGSSIASSLGRTVWHITCVYRRNEWIHHITHSSIVRSCVHTTPMIHCRL